MKLKPITPTMHAAIDYGFLALLLSAPRLFSLYGAARTLCFAFAGAAAVIIAFSNHRLAIKPLMPMRVHGYLDAPFVPAILLLPWLTGALAQPNARIFFTTFFVLTLFNYLLTDYRVEEEQQN